MTEENSTVNDDGDQSSTPDFGSGLDFSTFLISLGTSALIQLGEAPDPTSDGRIEPDIQAARQTIDLLGMLETKTEGNRTKAEDGLLKNLLRDLRFRAVQTGQ